MTRGKLMRLLLGLLLALALPGCVNPDAAPKTHMYVVEHGEIVGNLPGPSVYVRLVADSKRNLCFVLFQAYESTSVVKIDCATVKFDCSL